jgi:Rrf2 family protein
LQPSSRFAVAVHAIALSLVARAEQSGRPITSEEIASMVGVHAVHVRRVLGVLREAGLLISQPGPGGGWKLARAPGAISLFDVLEAVEPESPLVMPARAPSGCCRFAPDLPVVLERCLKEARMAVEERLSQITVADLIAAARPLPPAVADVVVDFDAGLATI